MSISLILLSAGDSSRFMFDVKKQWLRVGNEPLWLHVSQKISSFYDFDEVIIVAKDDEAPFMRRFCEFTIINGGKTRQESLKNALKYVKSDFVLVSDIARANISKKLVNRIIDAKNEADCIVPILKPVDTIYLNLDPINRDEISLIQTPQLSCVKMLTKALLSDTIFTDDSSAIAAIGGSVKFVKGSKKALKITRKSDLKTIKNLKAPSKKTFIGSGFDVHSFGETRKLILGGVKIHDKMGLKAHSDGDVLIHALIDALLGGIGYGDIGELFPDSDDNFKDIDSVLLLQKVYKFVKKVGYEINNCDITILAEMPKISPFKEDIAKNLALILGVKANFINIKATTTEKLGFIGRSEGIAVQAVVSLSYFDWTKK